MACSVDERKQVVGLAGVVDQHADATGPLPGGANRRAHAGLGSNICADERSARLGGRGLAGGLVEVGDDHVHALRGEPLRDPSADPVRPACYQGGRSREVRDRILLRGTDTPAGAANGRRG